MRDLTASSGGAALDARAAGSDGCTGAPDFVAIRKWVRATGFTGSESAVEWPTVSRGGSAAAGAEPAHPLFGLIGTLHAYDPYTSRHSIQVEQFACGLCRMLGVGERECEQIRLAAMLHDIGKMGVPIGILAKPGPLTAEEYAVVKKHPSHGAKILQSMGIFNSAVPFVLHHHEWFNGEGYEHGLRGSEIPLGARIIQAADCIDAMMSPRSYKCGYEQAKVISELRRGRGRQFDPVVADAAIQWLNDADPFAAGPSGDATV